MSFIRINNLDVSALVDGFSLDDASVETYDRTLNDSLEGTTYSVKKAISFSTDYLTGSDASALEGWVRGRGHQWSFSRYSNNTTQFSLFSNEGGVAMAGFNYNAAASISTATLWGPQSTLLNPSGTLTATVPFGSETDLTVSYMVRGGAINLMSSPDDFTVWSASPGASAVASTIASPSGAAANVLTKTGASTSIGLSRVASFTGNGTKACSIYLKAGTAAATAINLYDSTAVVNRFIFDVVWTAGVPSIANISGSGTTPTTENVGSGWYRIVWTVNAVVAANTNFFYIYPAGTGTATGTVYAWGVQVEDRPNLLPTDFTSWSLNSVTAASVASPGLGAPSYLLAATVANGYAQYGPAFSSIGTKTHKFFIKAGTAIVTDIGINTIGNTGFNAIIRYTWSAGVPSAAVILGSASVDAPLSVGSGWYLVRFTAQNTGGYTTVFPGGVSMAGGTAANVNVWFPETFEQEAPGQYDKLWYHRAIRLQSGATSLWSNLHRSSAATVSDIKDVSITTASGFATITLQGKDINGTAASVCYANVLVTPYAMTTSMITARSTMTTGWAQLPFAGVSGDALPLAATATGAEPGPITMKASVKTLDYKPVVVDGVFRYNARAVKITLEQR